MAQAGPTACARCAHHFITYDPRFPYGCRAMNFKSRQSPAAEILKLTGAVCQTFLARVRDTRRSPL